MKTSVLLLAFVSMMLASCGTKESLIRKSGVAPSGITLTGQWTLLDDLDIAKRQLDRAIGATNGVNEERAIRRRNTALAKGKPMPKGSVGGLVHVFLENGRALKITQKDSDLFISFDRSVVEEYHFGEARIISVGAVQAQRVSGWDGEQFVVETLDKDGMKLTERYHLIEEGMVLRRQIIFRSKGGEEVINFQTYEREQDK